MQNNTQGFTLIELLIVIAIIGILAAVLIPNLLGAQKRAYDTAAMACANEVKNKQAMYLIDKATYAKVAELTGDYKPSCDAKVTLADVNATPSATAFSVSAVHADGTKKYTITNEGLTNAPK